MGQAFGSRKRRVIQLKGQWICKCKPKTRKPSFGGKMYYFSYVILWKKCGETKLTKKHIIAFKRVLLKETWNLQITLYNRKSKGEKKQEGEKKRRSKGNEEGEIRKRVDAGFTTVTTVHQRSDTQNFAQTEPRLKSYGKSPNNHTRRRYFMAWCTHGAASLIAKNKRSQRAIQPKEEDADIDAQFPSARYKDKHWIANFSVGQRPFKCSYCPYSASQKGNLKTHVLCVHRMPFDNSQYPDRRFKRSRPDSEIPEKNSDDAVFGVNQPTAGEDGSNGNNFAVFAAEAASYGQE
ncbi:hypothetical protein EXN66_Car002631 [Channa argus]|uniref:C2H2-type domain-containing protein n=1 Tax=Channa argus TaxID=215402 RepID=A0A6G1P9S6_CHAAH|nr:hypothetical protein EXN66_Car002631 [Channa argus]